MRVSKEDLIFLDILSTRIPERKKLVNLLENLLLLEKEAIYRRLRGIVPFSLSDIAKISRKLDISIDNVIGMGVDSSKIRSGRIIYIDFLDPREEDYFELERYVKLLGCLKSSVDSEMSCSTNTLPQLMYISHQYLYKYYLFKWKYQQSQFLQWYKFSEVKPSERLIQINKKYINAHRFFKTINLILDRNMFEYIINDIHYFYEIEMIEYDEVLILKQDLHNLLDDLEHGMISCTFDQMAPLNIYLSNINLESTHLKVKINEHLKISMNKSFTITDTAAIDHYTYEKMSLWMNSLIKSSTLVSGSSEYERRNFLEEQRKRINQL